MQISLTEGDSITLKMIKNKIGMQSNNKSVIKFNKFEIVKGKKKENYKSYISFQDVDHVISVNNPVKIDNIYFYQNSWKLGIKKLIFSFRGKKYNVFKIKQDSLKTAKGNIFYFYPVDMDNSHNVTYKWMLLDKKENIIDRGKFQNHDGDTIKKLFKLFGFKIIQEKFKFITILDVLYKPLNNLIAFFSLLFLFNLGLVLFKK